MSHTLYICLCIWFLRGVFGDTNEVKSVSVMEEESVTLQTDIHVQQDDQILWMFNVNNADTRIAEIHRQNIYIYNKTVIFRDRLKMDSQTGSLTIRDIRTEHSGLYKLQIIQEKTTYRTFSVAVYANLPIPVIKSNSTNSSSLSSERLSDSRCSVLCSVVNVSAVSLSWYKGNSVLSSISVSDLSISLSLPLEVEYQDKNTYSCVINNTITNHTTHLDISQSCHTRLESRTSLHLLVVLLLLFLITVTIVTIFCHHKKHVKQKAQTNEEDIDYTEPTLIPHGDQDTRAEEQEQTVYSEVFLKC